MENNFDENIEELDPEKEEKILNNMSKKFDIPTVFFDFSQNFSNQSIKQSDEKVFKVLIKILEEIEEINDEVEYLAQERKPPTLYYEKGSPEREHYLQLILQVTALTQFYKIKNIPGYQLIFKVIPVLNSELVLSISKDDKYIISVTVKNNYDGVKEYLKKYGQDNDKI